MRHDSADPGLRTPPPHEIYTHGYGPEHQRGLAGRTAATEGPFLLPHLRPGMRLLDCGCGPGSITLDLAEIVAPGAVVGVDREPRQIERARAALAKRGLGNVLFEVAGVYDLPFAAASFDVVLAHAVLEHVREPVRALREMRRVLGPGGLVGVRDLDWGSWLCSPMTPAIERYWELAQQVFAHNGANEFLGRHHRCLLLEAGFARAEASVSAAGGGTLEIARWAAAEAVRQVREPPFRDVALEQGWADEATLAALCEGLTAWGELPDAFAAVTWCATVGWVDGLA